jgi:hypothetical protein
MTNSTYPITTTEIKEMVKDCKNVEDYKDLMATLYNDFGSVLESDGDGSNRNYSSSFETVDGGLINLNFDKKHDFFWCMTDYENAEEYVSI